MILYIIIGFVSDIISGMGIGGGTILIPALTIFYNMPQHLAQNINLIYFLPAAVVALITHVKNKSIETKVMWKLIIFGLLGAVAGSFIAINLNSDFLRKLFGYFLLTMGIMEIFRKEESKPENA